MTMAVERNGEIFEIPDYHFFEKKYGEGSWERFCELIARDCNRFSKIGREFGISRERVRQIFNDHVARYVNLENGYKRRRSCTLARVHRTGFPDYVVAAWRMARRNGISVSAVNSIHKDGAVGTLQNVLWFNDVLCVMHAGDAMGHTTLSKKGLVRFTIRRRKRGGDFRFHVCVISFIDRHWSNWIYYIIPEGSIPKSGGLDIPASSVAERGLKREAPWAVKSDWSPYRNAWHLIPSLA